MTKTLSLKTIPTQAAPDDPEAVSRTHGNMPNQLSRRSFLAQSTAISSAIWSWPALVAAQEAAKPKQKRKSAEGGYQSPYQLRLRHSQQDLTSSFNEPPWNSPNLESETPHGEWYSPAVRKKYGPWGPVARQYPAAPGLNRRSVEWLQDRVIHSAARWIGLPYQHHHIPSWNPPSGWPWKQVAYGRNSPGIDCSNFSSFYYNYGLGVKLDTGIKQQAERTTVRGPGGRGVLQLERIEKTDYDALIRTLQPADLLYIRNNGGKLAHVIMFLGQAASSPDGTPLIIDSTGGGHVDCNGNAIPIGVHLRPFSPNSWYYKSFAHAHRIVHGVSRVRPGTAPEADEGGAEEVAPR